MFARPQDNSKIPLEALFRLDETVLARTRSGRQFLRVSKRFSDPARIAIAMDDAYRRKEKATFRASKKAENFYSIRLRKIAAHIAEVIRGTADNTLRSAYLVGEWAARYAETLVPWAEAVTSRMHTEIAASDKRAWERHSQAIGVALGAEVENAPTGEALQQLLREQVGLIKSLPIEAAQRVHELTLKGLAAGTRAEGIIAEIIKIGNVTKARATLIARTEIARTASVLTQVRAEHIGSEAYVWETVRDTDVRRSHRHMQGKIVRWDSPPTTDGLTYHAGQGPNCRCWCRPILKAD